MKERESERMAGELAEASYSFDYDGHCPVCDQDVTFHASGPYFRNTLICPICQSRPRHRALMYAIERMLPRWREYSVHESSPGWDAISIRLQKNCANYIASQYDTSHSPGAIVPTKMPYKTYRCENLECQTFEDEIFDLVVTQDVFEHINRPDLAIREIARTLKTGGAFIATVPIVRKLRPSQRRAKINDGEIVHLMDPEYHGNPLNKGGSIVTIDWGYDIVSYLQHHSQLNFLLLQVDNIEFGIRADLNEVLIGLKRPIPSL